ncbi:MAG: hypothetical protein KGH64_02905 [Candidatus Micrarchaeota archaeon]|nr:hypothetical protein [Candidatus Micrarchaeota archaeon]
MRTTKKSKKPNEPVSTMRVLYNGTKEWSLPNGNLHRADGPAIENANGDKFWYLNGKRHRTDGPAVEFADGTKYWYLGGKEQSSLFFAAIKLVKKNKRNMKPCIELLSNLKEFDEAMFRAACEDF